MSDFNIETVAIDSLRPHPRNYRAHPQAQIEHLEASLREYGWARNVVVASDGVILAGHGIVEAARRRGETTVPVHRLALRSSDPKAEKFMVLENEVSRLADDDDAQLAALLKGLADDGELLGTGYDGGDVEALLAELQAEESAQQHVEDPGPSEPPIEPVSKLGDVWLCGEHRVVCGDCTEAGVWRALMQGTKANVVFTSPPYAEQRKEQYGGIPASEYVEWFRAIADRASENLATDGSFFVNLKAHCEDGERETYDKRLVIAMREWGWKFIDEFCWRREGYPGGFKTRFKNEWEPVFHFGLQASVACYPAQVLETTSYKPAKVGMSKSGSGMLADRFGDGEHARPGNVVDIASAGPVDDAGAHPARFPLGLPAWFANAFTREGDIVADPFLGSGTTLIAAEKLGRVCYGIEIEPRYVDVSVRRWCKATGRAATLESTGEPFPVGD